MHMRHFVCVHQEYLPMSYVQTTQHHFESERFTNISVACQLNKVSFRNNFLKM